MSDELRRIAEGVRVVGFESERNISQITIQDVEDFYWEAMQTVGWPTEKVNPCNNHVKPGYKYLRHRTGKFTFVDEWSSHANGRSEGKTTIWFGLNPIWVMSYCGWYPKEVIPFLKVALMEMIEARRFMGGRGNNYYYDENYPDLAYYNDVERAKLFPGFVGEEKIYKKNDDGSDDTLVGLHRYQGMSLI